MPITPSLPLTPAALAEARYLEEGRRHLKRARARHCLIADDAEALVICVEDDPGVLTTRTVGLYRQQIGAMLRHLVPGDPERLAGLRDRVEAALSRRRGKPAQPRTASRKVRDASQGAAGSVLAELSCRVWRAPSDPAPAVLALAIYLHSRLGHRAIEGETARLEGSWLVLRNAKVNTNRAGAPERRIDLSSMHPLVRHAAITFIRLRGTMIARYGSYQAWHAAASEQLARVCRRVGTRRLCLSAFRHVALAAWKEAGLAPWVIAALAGHASDRSAGRYYAGARHGWAIEGLPRPEAIRVVLLKERARLHAERAQAGITSRRGEVAQDEARVVSSPPPQPASTPGRESAETGAAYWRRWVAAQPRPSFGSATRSSGTDPDERPQADPPGRR